MTAQVYAAYANFALLKLARAAISALPRLSQTARALVLELAISANSSAENRTSLSELGRRIGVAVDAARRAAKELEGERLVEFVPGGGRRNTAWRISISALERLAGPSLIPANLGGYPSEKPVLPQRIATPAMAEGVGSPSAALPEEVFLKEVEKRASSIRAENQKKILGGFVPLTHSEAETVALATAEIENETRRIA